MYVDPDQQAYHALGGAERDYEAAREAVYQAAYDLGGDEGIAVVEQLEDEYGDEGLLYAAQEINTINDQYAADLEAYEDAEEDAQYQRYIESLIADEPDLDDDDEWDDDEPAVTSQGVPVPDAYDDQMERVAVKFDIEPGQDFHAFVHAANGDFDKAAASYKYRTLDGAIGATVSAANHATEMKREAAADPTTHRESLDQALDALFD